MPTTAIAQAQPPGIGASAQVRDAGGRLLATALFREGSDQVLINLVFPDRTALRGNHGIQIHEAGRCDPPDFSSAGGILNPFARQHGLSNPGGPMAGDIPNLVIGADGVNGYNTAAPLVRLATGPAALLRDGGTSLVIDAETDDQTTQPEGNPGARLACGVIVAGLPSAAVPLTAPAGSSGPPSSAGGISRQRTAAWPIAGVGTLLIAAGMVLRRGRAPKG